jgi:hypothetical protein
LLRLPREEYVWGEDAVTYPGFQGLSLYPLLRRHAAATPQAAAAANKASVPGSGTALIPPAPAEPLAAGAITPPPLVPVACEPNGAPAIRPKPSMYCDPCCPSTTEALEPISSSDPPEIALGLVATNSPFSTDVPPL